MSPGNSTQATVENAVDFTMTDFRIAQIVRKKMRTTKREVAAASHLSGVARSVSKLVDAKIVTAHEPDASAWKRLVGAAGSVRRGRPEHWLTLSRDLGFLIGVDIAHQGVAVTITRAEFGKVLKEPRRVQVKNLDDNPEKAFDTAAELIVEVFEEARDLAGAEPDQVIGIGVGLPAPVSRETKTISPEMHILSAWSSYEPEQELAKRLAGLLPKVPIEVDNDASLGALGVYSWETLSSDPAMAPRDLLYVRVGDGIGAGVVIKGKLVGGGSGFAGEIGHVKVDERGHFCPRCGQRGCVETKASEGSVLAELAPTVFDKAPAEVTIADILGRDHPACNRSLYEAGWSLGIALAHARTLLDPRRIYIGGEMASARYFMLGVAQGIVNNSLSLAIRSKELVVSSPSSLPEERSDLRSPELLGAFAIALHRCGDRYIERKIGLNRAV
jgi:predicted NBD/HSP70 family sugar kinase